MIRRGLSVLFSLFAAAACSSTPQGSDPSVLAITDVTVIQPAAEGALARRTGQTVVVRGGRIKRVGPSRTVRAPRGARVLDGRGRYLIPGLWEAHAHVGLAQEPALMLYAAQGVTSLRDMGGSLGELKGWRERIASGALVGPEMFISGPVIEADWWLDGVTKAAATDPVLKSFPFLDLSPRRRVASEAEARESVREQKAAGVDQVKMRNLRGPVFRALAAEAQAQAVPLAGHAPGGITIAEAAEAGMRSLEHMETITLKLGEAAEAQRRAQFERLARAGAVITPTLIADIAYRQIPDERAYAVIADAENRIDPRRRYLTRRMLDAWKFGLDVKKLEGPPGPPEERTKLFQRQLDDLRLARAAGVPMLVGTDLAVSMIYPGYGVHEEMRLLVERGGLSPLEVLRAATVTPARLMGRGASLGSITAGMEADLVLLDADPLADISAVGRIAAVVLNGRALGRPELDALMAQAAEAAAVSRAAPR